VISVRAWPVRVEARALRRWDCPTCAKSRFAVGWFYEWHGWTITCLRCGDSWGDGYRLERPFMRGWRKKAVARVKKWWRAERPDGREIDRVAR
jgi:hypothetical protein